MQSKLWQIQAMGRDKIEAGNVKWRMAQKEEGALRFSVRMFTGV